MVTGGELLGQIMSGRNKDQCQELNSSCVFHLTRRRNGKYFKIVRKFRISSKSEIKKFVINKNVCFFLFCYRQCPWHFLPSLKLESSNCLLESPHTPAPTTPIVGWLLLTALSVFSAMPLVMVSFSIYLTLHFNLPIFIKLLIIRLHLLGSLWGVASDIVSRNNNCNSQIDSKKIKFFTKDSFTLD